MAKCICGCALETSAGARFIQGHNSRVNHHMLGKHHTRQANEKNRLKHLGTVAWNRGKKMPKEYCDKLAAAHHGKHSSPDTEFVRGHALTPAMRASLIAGQFKKGYVPWNKGKYEPEKYLAYRAEVRALTKKIIKGVYASWDGRCCYTGDYIRGRTDKKKPTIDHKIPIYIGFLNSLPFEMIGGAANICICSKDINSGKRCRVPLGLHFTLKNVPIGFWKPPTVRI